jgi:hypothetical protein
MNFWSGYIGLTIAFVLLAGIVLWFFIKTPGRTVIKVLLITLTVWYGLVLYYTAPNLMGWPTPQAVPENSLVLAIRIKEPDTGIDDSGAIFLWISTPSTSKDSKKASESWFNPKSIFKYDRQSDPRAYKLPYSREMHDAIIQAQRQAQETLGALILVKKRVSRQGTGTDESKGPLELEIINPARLLAK